MCGAGSRAAVRAGLPVCDTASAGQSDRRERERTSNGGEKVAGRPVGIAATATPPRGWCAVNNVVN